MLGYIGVSNDSRMVAGFSIFVQWIMLFFSNFLFVVFGQKRRDIKRNIGRRKRTRDVAWPLCSWLVAEKRHAVAIGVAQVKCVAPPVARPPPVAGRIVKRDTCGKRRFQTLCQPLAVRV